MDKMIFVFGSNEGGYHGAGAARTAREQYDAEMGVPFGPTGRAFAIPTKDSNIRKTLPLLTINLYVEAFLAYAKMAYAVNFQVTCIGCGLAGLKHQDIAPMFADAPDNCYFDTQWVPILGPDRNYWGTF